MFDIVLNDSMLHYTRMKKIIHAQLSGFTGLCILHWILFLIQVLIGQFKSLLVDFLPKIDFGQV